jgi:hypothetical protein
VLEGKIAFVQLKRKKLKKKKGINEIERAKESK